MHAQQQTPAQNREDRGVPICHELKTIPDSSWDSEDRCRLHHSGCSYSSSAMYFYSDATMRMVYDENNVNVLCHPSTFCSVHSCIPRPALQSLIDAAPRLWYITMAGTSYLPYTVYSKRCGMIDLLVADVLLCDATTQSTALAQDSTVYRLKTGTEHEKNFQFSANP